MSALLNRRPAPEKVVAFAVAVAPAAWLVGLAYQGELGVRPVTEAIRISGDWALRLAVNTGLAQIFRSGQIVGVFKKWFSEIDLRPGILLGSAYTLGGLSD